MLTSFGNMVAVDQSNARNAALRHIRAAFAGPFLVAPGVLALAVVAAALAAGLAVVLLAGL
jgi:hypothetical protein